MNTTNHYFDINKSTWNERVALHLKSEMYNLQGFLAGENTLSYPDMELLGDLRGKSLLHLQCHFGMDTLSLAREGAVATGVDFSETAIAQAHELSRETGIGADFVCSNIYNLPDVLEGTFDIVYTSYGVIDWLPDLDKWAALIYRYLKPGGKFIMVEFHPILWMFDNEFKNIIYSYFRAEPFIQSEGSYTDNGSEAVSQTINWSHSMAEPADALLRQGIQLTGIKEYLESPYNLFSNFVKTPSGGYQIKGMEGMIPMLYSLTGVK